jgi:CRISPR system Cascade subunit CasD
MAFGDTMIDATGPTRDLPIVSAITGLIANALGWQRGQRELHQRLQDRLVVGARLDRPGTELRDFQTAQLAKSDEGWTTFGRPEGRAGGDNTYNSPHIRERFYRADAIVTIALRLEPADDEPDLDAIASALHIPARPLFIGRKPCLPSTPILAGRIDAASTINALRQWPLAADAVAYPIKVVVPRGRALSGDNQQQVRVADRRNWISGVHAGESDASVIMLNAEEFAHEQPKPEVAI